MLWNQTESRPIGFIGLGQGEQAESETESNSQTVAADIHRMKIDKVQPLVARFLGIEPERMPEHFRPATEAQLAQILAIRQHFVSHCASEDESYLRWRYCFDDAGASEDASSDLDRNRLWVFCKDGEILGFVGVESRDLVLGGKTTRAIKLMDLVVKPQLDRKGLGVWMNLRLQSLAGPIITLGSNRNSVGIMSKIFQRLPNQRVYKNVLNGRVYIKARLAGMHEIRSQADTGAARRIAAYLMATAYDTGFPLLLKARSAAILKGYRIAPITRFDDSHDAALRAMSGTAIQFLRNSSYLNWRLFDNPRETVEVAGLWRKDSLVGYVAIALRSKRGERFAFERAFLLDWGAIPGAPEQAALAQVLIDCQRRLRRAGFESITAFGYGPAHDRLLRRAGLYLREDDTKTVSIFSNDKAVLHKLLDADNWHITGADTDYA